LLAHHQYFNLYPTASSDQHPPADEVARIRRTYASTFAFLIAALGTHARVLALSIGNLHGKQQLVPDAELATKGVPIPGAQAAAMWACARAQLLSGGGSRRCSRGGCCFVLCKESGPPLQPWCMVGARTRTCPVEHAFRLPPPFFLLQTSCCRSFPRPCLPL
jgi:hypothetical protein